MGSPGPLKVARAVLGFVPRQWWRRPPFLPLPDRSWVRFRMETAYGSPDARPPRGDLVAFLRWAADMRVLARKVPRP